VMPSRDIDRQTVQLVIFLPTFNALCIYPKIRCNSYYIKNFACFWASKHGLRSGEPLAPSDAFKGEDSDCGLGSLRIWVTVTLFWGEGSGLGPVSRTIRAELLSWLDSKHLDEIPEYMWSSIFFLREQEGCKPLLNFIKN
jgi:hypothetical protein